MADHELIANDTEPALEGYLDYDDLPIGVDGSAPAGLPALTGSETITFVMARVGGPAITGPMTIVNPATRRVRHNFTKAETAVPGDYRFTVQVDYADGRRHTHPLGEPRTLKIWPDLGGPA